MDSGVAQAWPELAAELEHYVAAHADALELLAPVHEIPGGEAAKNDPALLRELLDAFHAHHLDRHAYVLAIGGGAVLDLVGYAAAITHRGIRHVRLPSTVLSQADSGVGVKNGVNAYGKKNFWGTFTPPCAVINDTRLLGTLSRRDRIAGMAEAVKVALVRDRAFFEWIEGHTAALAAGDPTALGELVERCAELHLAHIATAGDPFELGSARPLDFGHWSAHKLETMTSHRLRHGEAVAIGMALDMRYAALMGLCSHEDAARVCTVLKRLGFSLWDAALAARAADGVLEVLSGLADFREHLGGELTVPLLTTIGRTLDVHEIDTRIVARSIAELGPQGGAFLRSEGCSG
jgi:3-dehydroquinate synthase